MLYVFASWKLEQHYTQCRDGFRLKAFDRKLPLAGWVPWDDAIDQILKRQMLLLWVQKRTQCVPAARSSCECDVEIITYNLYMYKNYRPVLKEEKLQIYFLNNLYQTGWNDCISFDFVRSLRKSKLKIAGQVVSCVCRSCGIWIVSSNI